MSESTVSVNVEPHVKGYVLRCSRCGLFLAVEEPVDARRFFASLKAFIYAHEQCQPGERIGAPARRPE